LKNSFVPRLDFTRHYAEYALEGVQRISVKEQGAKAASMIDFDKYGCRIYASQGALWYAISEKSVSKLKSIEATAKYFGLALSDVAAFGDDFNDVDMLKECGVGVAVSNAIDEAKAAADFICESNDEDGVAKWIEENIL